MFNYSMMNPMMNDRQYSGNEYISMRARYGYPYATHDYPPTPMTPAKREAHGAVERNPFRNFLKRFFKL